MDYMPFGEMMREHNVGGTSYQYTGQEYDEESGIHNYRARLYDSDLGRFYGMDPQEQFASPFSYAGNNPVMMTDPDGEFAFVPLLVAMAKAAAIGVAANGISNTFIQDKPFFSGAGRAAWQGALGGGLAHGIGLGAQALANGGASAFQVGAYQATAHALSGGLQSTLGGGNFKSGFLSGGISSTLGSLTAGWGDGGQLFTGIVGGGIGSELGGGSFIDGARMGAITVGLNHLADQVQKVNLGNSNHRELTNEMMKKLYKSFNGGSNYLEDIFDYTNVGKNFNENTGYGIWKGKLIFKTSDGVMVSIKTSLVLTPKKFGLYLVRKSPENIQGRESPSKYMRNVGDGSRTNHPYVYRFSDQNFHTLAKFSFHHSNVKAYGNFISFMNTGKTKYLFK